MAHLDVSLHFSMAIGGSVRILGVRTESEGIEMSVDTPPETDRSPVLRREALLPNERSRGLGTVAVVCTMAGVASGLALATTLMAMQVADCMSVRHARTASSQADVAAVDVAPDHGFLGIRYVFHDGVAEIDSVLPGTPAEAVACTRRPRVSIDGAPIRLRERAPGAHLRIASRAARRRSSSSATATRRRCGPR